MTLRSLSLYFVFASILCLMASCTKSTYHEPVFARADVPTPTSGSWWRYRVRDSIHNNRIDTLTLSIASTTPTGTGITALCYIVDTGAVIDSGYMVVSDSALTFSTAGGRLGDYHIRLPFAAGDSWLVADSDRVSVLPYLLNVDIQRQNYYVFDLSRTRSKTDSMLTQHLQLSRFIGVVSEGYHYTGLPAQVRFGAELIDYHIQ